jgi:hypothetical protein
MVNSSLGYGLYLAEGGADWKAIGIDVHRELNNPQPRKTHQKRPRAPSAGQGLDAQVPCGGPIRISNGPNGLTSLHHRTSHSHSATTSNRHIPLTTSGLMPRPSGVHKTNGGRFNAVRSMGHPRRERDWYYTIQETSSNQLSPVLEDVSPPGKLIPIHPSRSLKELFGPRLTQFYRTRYADEFHWT